MDGGLYLYGVIQSRRREEFGRIGIGRKPPEVFSIVVRDVACVVSPWEEETVPATAEYAQGHERVLLNVAERFTVLPFEFGTIAPDPKMVEQLLKSNLNRFKVALRKLKGKVEVQLIASWHDMKYIFEEILKEHHAIARYKEEILRKPMDQTYHDRIQIGEMIAEALGVKKAREAERIARDLRRHADKLVLEQPIGDAMVFRGFCLMKKDHVAAFERQLQSLDQRFDGRLDWKYTGPLPCYHCANVPIKL
jgi:hypothetical protein